MRGDAELRGHACMAGAQQRQQVGHKGEEAEVVGARGRELVQHRGADRVVVYRCRDDHDRGDQPHDVYGQAPPPARGLLAASRPVVGLGTPAAGRTDCESTTTKLVSAARPAFSRTIDKKRGGENCSEAHHARECTRACRLRDTARPRRPDQDHSHPAQIQRPQTPTRFNHVPTWP